MGLKTWLNGEKAEIVQKIVEYNFKILGKYLSRNVLSLSTNERNLLTSDYLSDGLLVFDTTLGRWLQYKNGNWIGYESPGCEVIISSFDWIDGTITIPYETHLITSPSVQLYILKNSTYELVFGGVEIDKNNNVILSSDLSFEGKVVIK